MNFTMGGLEGTLPKEETSYLEVGQQGATTKVHLLEFATHFITKDRWGASLRGMVGTSLDV
jgi:hypothetical protein